MYILQWPSLHKSLELSNDSCCIIHMTRIAIMIKLHAILFADTHIDHAQVTTLRHFRLLL